MILIETDIVYLTEKSNVIMLSVHWQTVQIQIRLLPEEQSDQGLHCLLVGLHLLDKFLMERPLCSNF